MQLIIAKQQELAKHEAEEKKVLRKIEERKVQSAKLEQIKVGILSGEMKIDDLPESTKRLVEEKMKKRKHTQPLNSVTTFVNSMLTACLSVKLRNKWAYLNLL